MHIQEIRLRDLVIMQGYIQQKYNNTLLSHSCKFPAHVLTSEEEEEEGGTSRVEQKSEKTDWFELFGFWFGWV